MGDGPGTYQREKSDRPSLRIYIYIFARRSVEIARFPREARNERRGGEREKG